MAKKTSAVDKIDMANCYRLLIDMELFDETDGPDNILEQVENEVRQFATYRLEMLLGERDNKGAIQIKSPTLPFTDKEISVLKELANTGTSKRKRKSHSKKEEVQEEPEEEVFWGSSEESNVRPTRKRRGSRKKAKQPAKKTAKTDEQSDQKTFDSLDQVLDAQKNPSKRQRVLKDRRPKPAPSQDEMDMWNAQQAREAAAGFEADAQVSMSKFIS